MFYFYWTRKGPYKDELVIKDEFLNVVFESKKASSYPDYPNGVGIFNDGTPDATVKNGKYLLKEKIQKNLYGADWRVLEIVNMDGGQDVPCIRKLSDKVVISSTQGANVHWRPDDLLHKNYAKSTACFTLLKDEFLKMREAVGMTNESFKSGRLIGVLVIDGDPVFDQPYPEGLL